MNHLYYLFYPTARHRIKADQQDLNNSEFNYINNSFQVLNLEMNVLLYDELVRLRDHHQNRHFNVRRPDFDFN